ncbi:MAG: DNA topoisomerase IB [Sphingobium sp.]|nr:DNA topoisomerase IB [Sphingobium sp.]
MARLVHVDERMAGITRRALRGHWAYFDPGGRRITDRDEIDRLDAIALPPAYTDAWFAPVPNAHLLATGLDARGRKQYRYHPAFVAARDFHKFERCAAFGEALPLIRARVERDLAQRRLSAERAIASVVRLLDTGRIRVGNEAYAKANKSFGATTLRTRHARVDHGRLTLKFLAKSGKQCRLCVSDRGLVRFVKQVQDLPGQHLFQYLLEDGSSCPVGSREVNAYIHEAMGEDFTAKDFRTWRASALAFEWLAGDERGGLQAMLDFVSAELCNTPAIARKSYVHPALIDIARNRRNTFREELKLPRATKWLSRHERGLIAFLA